MEISLDCYPCFLKQALRAARAATDNAAVHEKVIREISLWAARLDLAQSPPEAGKYIYRRVSEIVGVGDPFAEAKRQANAAAEALLPVLDSMLDASGDRLAAATRLAIAGNVIDMATVGRLGPEALERAVREAAQAPLVGDLDSFLEQLGAASSVLYLADNAGEIVFDKILIEEIGPDRVTVVVRGEPVINDATMADAREVGLDGLVRVLPSGSSAPGTVLKECSGEVRALFREADLVISKGQGNFETLDRCGREVFFLFVVKCEVVAQYLGERVGASVLFKGGGVET